MVGGEWSHAYQHWDRSHALKVQQNNTTYLTSIMQGIESNFRTQKFKKHARAIEGNRNGAIHCTSTILHITATHHMQVPLCTQSEQSYGKKKGAPPQL